jgi:hypothetical protein
MCFREFPRKGIEQNPRVWAKIVQWAVLPSESTSKSGISAFIRLRRRPRALPVDECGLITDSCAFGFMLRRISLLADNPPKPWYLHPKGIQRPQA